MVELLISRKSSWLFNDHAFISSPPTAIQVTHAATRTSLRWTHLFFVHDQGSHTRRAAARAIILFANPDHSPPHRIANVPLPLFLICPRLREVFLDQVGATEKSYDKYPDDQCSGREAPLLEVLNYRNSHSLVKQMITPPPRFNTPVVLWSKLRVLTLSPRDKEGMACLQPILDAACNTLEELYLTRYTIWANVGVVFFDNTKRI
jgi:hypothetical protein